MAVRKARRSALLDFGGRRSPGIWGVLERVALAAAGILCGVLLFDRVLMPQVVRHGDDVQVPFVAGRNLAQAEEELRDAGLEPVLMAGRHHPEVPAGRVLELSPSIGQKVKRGRQIRITPSLGAVSHTVPDVVGMSVRMARMELTQAGLHVRRSGYAATDLVEPDQVMALEPEAGTPAPPEGEVTLLVSQRRAPVAYWLPDLRGLSGRESAAWLQSQGFRAELIETAPAGMPGLVVAQTPPPGTPVWRGTRVELAVAPGEPVGSWRDRG